MKLSIIGCWQMLYTSFVLLAVIKKALIEGGEGLRGSYM
jgi:hypothetical protein